MNDEDIIRKHLKSTPSSFLLRDCLSARSKASVKCIINKLLSEVNNNVYELVEEQVRTYNLVSFLYWSVGEKADGKLYNDKVLKMGECNIIAIANLIWFSLEEEDGYELSKSYKRFLDIRKTGQMRYLSLQGEAELAYCYTRLGLKYYETAVKHFNDVLEKVQGETIDKNSIMLWKFGLGLSLRRLSRLDSTTSEVQVCSRNERKKEAVTVFLSVIKDEWDSNRLKAMAYIQLGELCFAVEKERLSKHIYFPKPFCNWSEETFYRKALEICDWETYVLERYGKFLRYRKRFEEAETILRKSIYIRPTSFAHHHLALTLKSNLHKELAQKFRRNYNGPNATSHRDAAAYRRSHSENSVRNLFSTPGKHCRTPKGSFQCTDGPDSNYAVLDSYAFTPLETAHKPGFAFSPGQSPILKSHANSYNRKTTSCSGRGTKNIFFKQNSSQNDQQYACTEKQRYKINVQKTAGKQPSTKEHEAYYSHERVRYDSGIDSMSNSLSKLSIDSYFGKAADMNTNLKSCDRLDMNTKCNSAGSGRIKEPVNSEVLQSSVNNQSLEYFNLKQAKAMIKSPKKPLQLPRDDKRTDEILYHLEQAICVWENQAALYEKGLTLRALNNLDEAIHVFKTLFTCENSLVYLANAYEQCALCLYDKLNTSDKDSGENEKQKLEYNMKDYFMKSVAISAKLVSEIPNVTEVWSSATSLKDILSREANSKESLRQLAVLSERLNNYKEAVTYYNELLKLEENVEQAPKLMLNIARNQMQDKKFIAALTAFDMIRSHPEGDSLIDQNMYRKCLLEAGFNAVLTGVETQFGRTYLQSAFRYNNELNAHGIGQCDINETTEDEDEFFEAFVLCPENNTTVFKMAVSVFNFIKQECGLNVTLNSMDVMLGTSELSETLSLIDKSETFIIFVGKSDTGDKLYQRCLEHIILNKAKIIVILEDKEVKTPNILHRFKERIHSLVYEDSPSENSVRVEWVKELFVQLLCLR